jgi:hypothetical protein
MVDVDMQKSTPTITCMIEKGNKQTKLDRKLITDQLDKEILINKECMIFLLSSLD